MEIGTRDLKRANFARLMFILTTCRQVLVFLMVCEGHNRTMNF